MYQSLYELFSGLGGNALNSFLSLAMDLIRKMFAASGNCCLVRRKVWSSFPLIRHFLKTLWHVSWLSCTPRLASHLLCFITTPTNLDVKWKKMDCLAEACSHFVHCACVLLILSCKYASLLLFSWSGEFRSEKSVFLQSWESNVQFSQIVAIFTGQSLYSNENPSSWSHSNPLRGEVLPLLLNKVLCRMRTSFLRTMPFHTWSYQNLGMFQVLAVANKVSVLPVCLFE